MAAAVEISGEIRGEMSDVALDAPPAKPRPITAEVRKRVGLPKVHAKYPWARAVIASAVFGVPLSLAGFASIAIVIALVALGVLPAWREVERREARARERLYEEGDETVARVVEIEPAGTGRRDHVVQVEYFVDTTRHEAKIVAAPLARQGLRPGDDALVVFDRAAPTRCLLIRKIARKPAPVRQIATTATASAPDGAEIFDAVFDEDEAPTGGGCGGGCACR